MITAQNGKGSRPRKVDMVKYRSSKLWDRNKHNAAQEQAPPLLACDTRDNRKPRQGLSSGN